MNNLENLIYNEQTGEFEERVNQLPSVLRKNNRKYILLFVIISIVLLICFLRKPNKESIIEEQMVSSKEEIAPKNTLNDYQHIDERIINELEQDAPIVSTEKVSPKNTQTIRNQEEEDKLIYSQESSDISRSIGVLRLSYGIYSGEILNGYPDGNGSLVYTERRVINRLDKRNVAEVGDSIAGCFVRGFAESYRWYDVLNTIKSEEEEPGIPDGYEEL